MSATDRESASLRICDRIVSTAAFRQASTIGCYLATDSEVETWSLIERALRRNKRIFVPTIKNRSTMRFAELDENSRFRRNRFGIPEPDSRQFLSPGKIDLVISPVVAFDSDGRRIGMGGGYFDRTFSFLKHRKNFRRPKLIGVAFDCQQVERIDANPWDIALLDIVTENGVLKGNIN